jgi:CheY-like chemotaxis protein
MRTSADPHILFVEDNPDDADLACWQLSKGGIVFTSSMVWMADELMEQLETRTPEVIISDFQLPGFDGWAAFRMAQAMTPATPFIFHSGSIGEERCKAARTLGAFGCIEKDQTKALVDLVRRALSGRMDRAGDVG